MPVADMILNLDCHILTSDWKIGNEKKISACIIRKWETWKVQDWCKCLLHLREQNCPTVHQMRFFIPKFRFVCWRVHTKTAKKKAVWKILSAPLLWDGKDEESRNVRGRGGCPCILVMCYSCKNPWRPRLVPSLKKKSHAFKSAR